MSDNGLLQDADPRKVAEAILQGGAKSNAPAPSYWMTEESKRRLAAGGNSKGAVPVHGKRSVMATIPLYTQEALDAAVQAEREWCTNNINWVNDSLWFHYQRSFSAALLAAIHKQKK